MLRQRLIDKYAYTPSFYTSTPKTHNPKKEKYFLSEWKIAAIGLFISLAILISKVLYSHNDYVQQKLLLSYEVLAEESQVMLKRSISYSRFWLPALCGFFTTYFTWIMVYLDSNIPGVDPPSPFSPKKYRVQSGHTFHLNYVFAILIGMVVFIYTFWKGISIEF